MIVQGKHEPIISEELFYDVQDILNGRKKPASIKKQVRETFPLRNFLVCPECGRLATASSSKGKYTYYDYYHCQSMCGWRYRADLVNNSFIEELKKYKPHPEMLELYREVILDVYDNYTGKDKLEKKAFIKEINEQNTRIAKARDLLLADKIDSSDYKTIKMESEQVIQRLEAKLGSPDISKEKIDTLLDSAH